MLTISETVRDTDSLDGLLIGTFTRPTRVSFRIPLSDLCFMLRTLGTLTKMTVECANGLIIGAHYNNNNNNNNSNGFL